MRRLCGRGSIRRCWRLCDWKRCGRSQQVVRYRCVRAGNVRVRLIRSHSQKCSGAEILTWSCANMKSVSFRQCSTQRSICTYQEKVVTAVLARIPHPVEQAWLSTHAPASPQSLAAMTVVGQNPHSAFWVSKRQSKPASAVRGWSALPSPNPHVATS